MTNPSREQVLEVVREIKWACVEGQEFGGLDEDAAVDDFLALFPAPRVVTTVAELEALPEGSRIQMTGTKAPFVKQDGEWWSTHVPGKPVYDYLQDGFFPATVLTPAPEREPVTAEQVEAAARAAFEVDNPKDGLWSWEWSVEHYPNDVKVWRRLARAALRAAGVPVTDEEATDD